MSKHPRIILTALGIALLAGPALAQGPRAGWFAAEGSPGLERLEILDLGEEQEKAVEGILAEAREQGVELRKQQARLRNEIHGEMLADAPSEQTLIDLTEKLGALRTQLQVIRLKARLAVRAELTEEQRDRLLLMGDRMGPRGPHRRHAPHAPHALEDRLRLHRHRFLELHSDGDDDDEI